MTSWDTFFDEKIREIAQASTILDVGGGRKLNKQLFMYRDLFKNCVYETLDQAPEYDPDILGSITDIPKANESVDAIICKAVLEHVQEPHRAVDEMYRVLKKRGKIFIFVPFLYPYHSEKGVYGDYFRFTEAGMRYLLRDFSHVEFSNVRGLFGALVNLLPLKIIRSILMPVAQLMDRIIPSKNQTSGYNIFAIK